MRKRLDTSLLVSICILVAFGVMMVYSASSVVALTNYRDANYFFNKTLLAASIGFAAMIVAANTSSTQLKVISRYALHITLLLLISVLVAGREINGATRWIIVGPLQFQPSEIAKISFTLYLAAWFTERRSAIHNLKETFLPLLVVLGVIGGLMLMEPDFGTFTVFIVISLAVYWVAGMSYKQIIIGFLVLMVALAGILSVPYRRKRLQAYFNPDQGQSTVAYQIRNINLAVGSGGWLGLGFGQSRQKRLFLPEPHTDSIFAITVEELGFLVSAAMVILYAFVLYRSLLIAYFSADAFNRYLATGISSWLGYQAFLNLAAILRLVPLKGLPIPFISYGGTNLVITMLAAGILLSLSRETSTSNAEKQYSQRSRVSSLRNQRRRQ